MRRHWTLIKDTGYKRIYRLPFKVRYFKRPGDKELHEIAELFSDKDKLYLPDKFTIFDDTEAIDKVCISDAKDYDERLVYPVVYGIDRYTGTVYLCILHDSIDGYITSSNKGGDASTIYDDEVYLRHLRMLNKHKGGE